MKKTLITILSIGLGFGAKAQFQKVQIEATDNMVKEASGIVPTTIASEFIGFRNPPSDDGIWHPVLTKVSKNESEDNELLDKIKAEKTKLKMEGQASNIPQEKTTTGPKAPVVSTNFAGINNLGGQTPLDNTIAISDKDTIVDFVNSQVNYYTKTGTSLYSKSLYNFVNDNTVTNALCDPKVIWDNVARRFIYYCQVCDQSPTHSKIILGFSKTSNPLDGWWVYKFSGNPLNNAKWWDYPKMAVSTNDLFVTGNLFSASGTFDQSVIMQIQKDSCFKGGTPDKLYSGITGAFSILPVGYGQKGSYGPGIYAVSSVGATGGYNKYMFYDITNKIGGTPAPVLNTYNIAIANYSTAGNAPQKGYSIPLNTGDSRVLDGFYLKGTVHFVLNVDVGGGYCGFRYNRLDVHTLACGYTNFGNAPSTDICYPAVVSAVNDSNDNSVVMAYEEVGASLFPQTCAVACDLYGTFSAPVVVKAGVGFNHYSGSTTDERWGDYTGLCKRIGDPAAAVWMAGMYSSTSHDWQQWIAKLAPKNVGVEPVVAPEPVTAKVFPNPVVDRYKLRFSIPERQNIIINLTDMEGRTVVELYNGIVESGENDFAFDKGSLANGIYSLNIIGAKTNIRNERIVVTGK